MQSHHRSINSDSAVIPPTGSSPVIDLVTLTKAPVFDWPRLLLTMGAGVIGLLLLVGLARFLVVVLIQGQVEAQLEYLAHWLGLRSLNQFTWIMTFVLSALTVKPFLKKVVFIATGGLSRLNVADWILIFSGSLISLAMPMALENLVPVHEVDPASEKNWFHIDRLNSQNAPGRPAAEPPGRLGYVREDDGSLTFYNIPEITRPSDGTPILRVTREVQKEWQRLQEEKAKHERRQRAAEEADRQERDAMRRSHEERMAALRAETAREETARLAAQKAEADAVRAKAEAERQKQEATAEQARLQAIEAQKQRQAEQQRIETEQRVQREREDSQIWRQNGHAAASAPPEAQPGLRRLPLFLGMPCTIGRLGGGLVLWTDGPAALSGVGMMEMELQSGVKYRIPPGRATLRLRAIHSATSCFHIHNE